MNQLPQPLRRAQGIAATQNGLALFPGQFSPAGRAFAGHRYRLGAFRTFFGNDFNNFRDDITGPLHENRIAEAQVFAADFVLVVQGRPAHQHAADGQAEEPPLA